uniref:Uncharacterized protein n=1 Tax=Meloidogyne enterolobii TaxID=390850 RepID=A0A6V7W2B0_MELEN|nr:unnamed protein product [Meloidogyne enterolobii]
MSKISQKDIAHIQRYLKFINISNDKSKIPLKDNRSQQAETTDSTMECDPTPTIGIATTESSAPPTTETTPTHPRVQPPSPPAATHETTDDEPAAVDIPLPDGPPPLAALKLPQRLNIASRVRILESGKIEALPINEHTIKKNLIRKWERTRNKRIHKRITISKSLPLIRSILTRLIYNNLLTPPPPPTVMPNLKNTPAPSIQSLCSPSIGSAAVPTYMPTPQISFVAVPILTPATPFLPLQFVYCPTICCAGSVASPTRIIKLIKNIIFIKLLISIQLSHTYPR